MPQYKLTYFSVPGRAETARILFQLAGVDFEDDRFKQADWPVVKATTPFKQVPVLTIDGKMYGQSTAIDQYLANKFGYAGKTPEEALACHGVADEVGDLIQGFAKCLLAPDEKTKAENKIELFTQTLPSGFKCLETLVQDSGYFVGTALTWADIRFFVLVHDILPVLKPEKPMLEGFPKLQGLVQKVGENKVIAAWLTKRPASEI